MTTEERARVEVHDNGIAEVSLTRPKKLNALDPAMFEQLTAIGESLSTRRDVRVVILRGEGRAFCAGLDFESFMSLQKGGSKNMFERAESAVANHAQQVAWVWKQLPMPVIAVVHGATLGGGLQIALAADLRYAAPDLQMSVMEIRWGLVPDMSGTQTLRDLVRLDVAKELTFSGRLVHAPEAAALGLVTRVSDEPLDDALDLARRIAARSPDAIRGAKRLLEGAWHATHEEGLRMEAAEQRKLIGQPNQMEAVKANIEKRDPEFRDPS